MSHLGMAHVLAFVERHGYPLLFAWVLAEQSALPVPSAPLLIAAGALIRAGRLHGGLAIAVCLIAALIADSIWFQLGRHGGRRVLRLLCKVSLEPDSCVRQTENAFLKYGLKALLVSKFVPGLNTVAAPLAGHSRVSYRRFALYDSAGTLLWSGSYFALGYIFTAQLEAAVAWAGRLGANLFLVVAALVALWVAWKYAQRHRFLKRLEMARITPVELRALLAAGEDLFIVDLRSGLADGAELIPGSVRISPDELFAQAGQIPRDREIILFCS
jgi:membrane protein DedA with SNARE-associated domain